MSLPSGPPPATPPSDGGSRDSATARVSAARPTRSRPAPADDLGAGRDLATWLLEQIQQTVDTVARRLYEQDREAALLILFECDAKRRIIEAHKTTVERERVGDAFVGKWVDTVDVTCDVCRWADSQEGSACLTVKILALPYSDRPGYREEWRV